MRVIPSKDAPLLISQQSGVEERTLAEALEGLIGTISLEDVPDAREVKRVFGAIVGEKFNKRHLV